LSAFCDCLVAVGQQQIVDKYFTGKHVVNLQASGLSL